ncbi:copper homeostasis CutC domain-containing protein [Cladorrhinum sp. PSN332]|nr:copper homeostasis CutC domain-containing protein [Cladorrhinum sp. PSN332]
MAQNPVYRLEIPIFGPDSGLSAAKAGGVKQIELNRAGSYYAGGLTPTLSELQTLISSLSSLSKHGRRPTIRIMIRPRGPPLTGEPDFIYSDAEHEEMISSVGQFVDSGLLNPANGDGFVLGLLKPDGGGGSNSSIDIERVQRLVKEANGLAVVFHRAFDEFVSLDTTDATVRQEGIESLKEVGVKGILTSGGRGRAVDNVGVLRRLLAQDGERRTEIIVGGGVRSENLREIVEGIGGKEVVNGGGILFHSSCLRVGEEDGEEVFDEEEARELGRVLDEVGIGRVEG